MNKIIYILSMMFISSAAIAADITVNVTGFKHSNIGGTIGIICYNYTTGQTVEVSDVPISSPDPITISCAEQGWTGTPGDDARVAVVGDPKFINDSRRRRIIVYATGLEDITRTECRNNATTDRKFYYDTASDVMDCEGIDTGIDPRTGILTNAIGRIAVAFNGTVMDDSNICPCFSLNRLENIENFFVNNSPVCSDTTGGGFPVGGYISAIFPNGFSMYVSNQPPPSGLSCLILKGQNADLEIRDIRHNLSTNQRIACQSMIENLCN